ncbi:unnamed protein product [Soboliphyme baturini]|uniref:Prolyl endopeptidase n=1 Tax=Soboliphyme baturini TaxID=241478 RepID=A0A183IKH7_9BILA|nr:unnamed protein product [Soboliphyme baturini]
MLFGPIVFLVVCSCRDSRGTIIPRKVLLSDDDDYSSVDISGDGTIISYLASVNNTINIFVKNLPNGTVHQLTDETSEGIASYFWASDNRTILYSRDYLGDENWKIYSINTVNRKRAVLVDMFGVRSDLICASPLVMDKIIIGINNRSRKFSDAYTVDLVTGDMQLTFQNDYYSAIFCDMQLNIRLGVNETTDGGRSYFLLEVDNSTHRAVMYKSFDVDDSIGSMFLNFDRSGNVSYWLNNEGRDIAALVSENLDNGQQEVLHTCKETEIQTVLTIQATGTPALVFERYSVLDGYVLVPKIEPAFRRLKEFVGNTSGIMILGTSLDFKRWIVKVFSDKEPGVVYLYDLNNEEQPFTQLFRSFKQVLRYERATSKVFSLTTRDNLTEVCFFTFPPGSLTEDGYSLRPLPTVVYVHGGPWAQVELGFDVTGQLLASRGYLMIKCNFRGSTGYGKRHLIAGNGEWGRKMQHDLLDAVDWSVANNYTVRDRVAVMGHSYGGYAVLAALAFTPDFFACGIDMFGPSNLITLINSIPPYYKPIYYSTTYRIGGSPDSEEGREFLKSRSPLFFVDRMKKPLLIAQGGNDPRVKQQESDQIVRALESQNITVMYLLFPDEGHGFTRRENILALWAFKEHFLQRCLGGEAEPFGSDLEGSSVRVMVQHGYVNGTS